MRRRAPQPGSRRRLTLAVRGGEIREPRKFLPRAILTSVVGITTIYLAGTATLLVALPHAQIDIIVGIPQALAAVGERLGLAFFEPLTAQLLVIANLGSPGAWVGRTARLPHVVGVDRYLPAPLAAPHLRYGTPWIALLVQAVITTLSPAGYVVPSASLRPRSPC